MSLTDDKEPESLTLRDRFAIEILGVLLAKIIGGDDHLVSDPDILVANKTMKKESLDYKINGATHLAYYIADEMRRRRLVAFE